MDPQVIRCCRCRRIWDDRTGEQLHPEAPATVTGAWTCDRCRAESFDLGRSQAAQVRAKWAAEAALARIAEGGMVPGEERGF